MLSVLADRTYRHLFLAQIIALLGTGLATVALGLLAYDLAGERAGLVLGTVFTIKMLAYVGIAPIAVSGTLNHLHPEISRSLVTQGVGTASHVPIAQVNLKPTQ